MHTGDSKDGNTADSKNDNSNGDGHSNVAAKHGDGANDDCATRDDGASGDDAANDDDAIHGVATSDYDAHIRNGDVRDATSSDTEPGERLRHSSARSSAQANRSKVVRR
jgi:hypothetical protein